MHMRKPLIFIPLLFLGFVNLFAQNKTTDSLRQLLATAKDDTTSVVLMGAMARTYLYSKPDSCLLLGEQALKLSRKAGFKKGEFSSLRIMGAVFNSMGNIPKAL